MVARQCVVFNFGHNIFLSFVWVLFFISGTNIFLSFFLLLFRNNFKEPLRSTVGPSQGRAFCTSWPRRRKRSRGRLPGAGSRYRRGHLESFEDFAALRIDAAE